MQQLVLDQRIPDALLRSDHLVDFIWADCDPTVLGDVRWFSTLDDRAGLRLYAANAFLEFDERYREVPIVIGYEPGSVRISVSNGPVAHIRLPVCTGTADVKSSEYRITALPTLAASAVSCSSRDPSLRVAWKDHRDRANTIEMLTCSDSTFPPNIPLAPFANAYAAISRYWPEAAAELPLITRVIVPMDSGTQQRLAVTLPSRNGAIYLDVDVPQRLQEALLHENAHVKLHHIQYFDPLIAETESRYSVPWRPDPRPIAAILHGVFVYCHVAEYALRRSRAQHDARLTRAAQFVRWVGDGVHVLQAHAELTDIGRQFLAELQAWYRALESTCVHERKRSSRATQRAGHVDETAVRQEVH